MIPRTNTHTHTRILSHENVHFAQKYYSTGIMKTLYDHKLIDERERVRVAIKN